MSAKSLIIENDLCRCCHSQGSFPNLAEPCEIEGSKEVFSDMLESCFGISLAPIIGALGDKTYTICQSCTVKLRDAVEFKAQVIACEERFKEMYARQAIKVTDTGLKRIKDEPLDSEDSNNKLFILTDTGLKRIKDEPLDSEDSDNKLFICELKQENVEEDNSSVKSHSSGEDGELKQEYVEEDNSSVKSHSSGEDDSQSASRSMLRSLLEEAAEEKSPIKQETEAVRTKTPMEVLSEWKKTGQKVTPKFFLREEDYTTQGDTHTCKHCNKKYTNMNTLKKHIRTVHYALKRTEYSCNLCPEKFLSLGPLIRHKYDVHDIDERSECKACKKSFTTKNLLKYHTETYHMIREKHKCQFCDYECVTRSSLNKHKFKHKTVKDFKCRFCKKAFLRKSTMTIHEKIHTGDRRKICDVCGQAFVQKGSLNYHMAKHHPEVPF